MGPSLLPRNERLVSKPKVDYRQVAYETRWPLSVATGSNPSQNADSLNYIHPLLTHPCNNTRTPRRRR